MATKETRKKADATSKLEMDASEMPLLYQRLVEMSPNGILVIADNSIVFANQRAATILGSDSAVQLIGMEGLSFIPENEVELYQTQTQQGMEFEPDAPTFHITMRRLDSECVDVEGSTAAITHRRQSATLFMFQDISPRMALERALEDSERSFRELFEHSPIAYMPSMNGRILDANPKAEEVFGYTREELITMNKLDLTANTPAGRDTLAKGIDQGRAWAPPSNLKVEMRHKDGSEVWASVSSTTVANDDGEIEGRGMFVDITRQVQAEQELERTKTVYQTTYDNMREGILWANMDGRITHANPSLLATLGYTQEEITAITLKDLIPADHLDATLANRERLHQGKGFDPIEREWRKKDDSYIPVEVWASTVLGEDGSPTAIIMGVLDLTQRKADQARLQESETRYHAAYDHLQEGVLWVGKDGEIKDVNPAVQKMLGYTQKEFLALPMSQVVAHHHHDHAHRDKTRANAGETLPNHETEWVRKDGSLIPLEMWTTPIRTTKGGPFERMMVVRDLTAQKESERELQGSEERYRLLFQNAPTGAYTVSNKLITESNPELQALLKYTADELRGMPFMDLYADGPDGKDLVTGLMSETPENENTPNTDVKMVRSDGREVWVRRKVRWGWTGDGKPEGLGMVIDISAEKEAQLALIESEERYRLLYEDAPIGAYTTLLPSALGQRGKLARSNSKFQELLGYTAEELLTMQTTDLYVDGSEGKDLARHISETTPPGTTAPDIDLKMRRKNGEEIWVRRTARWSTRPDGETLGLGMVIDITKEKEAQLALAENEEKFRSLFERAPFAYLPTQTTPEGSQSIIDANPAAEELFGYTREELLGKQVVELAADTPDGREHFIHMMAQRKAGTPVHNRTVRMQKKDGTHVWAHATGGMSANGFGRGVYIDVTLQRQAEEALKNSEEQHRLMFNSAPIPYISSRLQHIPAANPKAAEALGYPMDELIGLPILDLFPNDDVSAKRRSKRIAEFDAGITAWDDEVPMLRKDGKQFIARFRSQLSRDADGVIVGLGAFDDISHEKESEKALQESEERYRALYETAPIPYMTITNGTVTAANPKASEILGYTMNELIGSPIEDFVADKDAGFQLLSEHLEEMKTGIHEWTDERLMSRKNGHILHTVFKTHISLDEDEQRTSRAAFIDITHEREMENALRESEERYRALYETAPIPYITTTDGIVTAANPHAAETLGYSVDELLGTHLWDYVADKEDSQRSLAERIPLMADGIHEWTNERLMIHKNGNVLVTMLNTHMGLNEDGQRITKIAFKDITHEREIEEALRTSEERYRTAYNNIGDAIIEYDSDGNIVGTNPALEQLTGYTHAELLLLSREQLVASAPPIDRFMERLIAGEPMLPTERTIIAKDGTHIPVERGVSLRVNTQGTPVGHMAVWRDLRAQRQAEEDLRSSEERYRRLFEGAPIPYLTTTNGLITAANPQAAAMFGHPDEKLMGMRLTDLMADIKEAQPLIDDLNSKVHAGTQSWDDERLMSHADGHVMRVRSKGHVGLTNTGDRESLATFMDITHEREMEDALRRSEERYHAIYESLHEGLLQIDRTGHIVGANSAMATMLGYSAAELVTLSFHALVEEDMRSKLPELQQQLFDGKYFPPAKKSLVHKDGSLVPFEVSTTLLKNESEEPDTILVVARDLRAQIEAEEALRLSEERYRRMFDNAPIAYIASQDGVIAEANPMASEMLGYSHQELIGMPSDNLFPDKEESKRRRIENHNRFERGVPEWDSEMRMLRKNGQELIVRSRGQMALDSNRKKVGLGTFIDITRQKEAEEALRQSEEHYHTIYDHLNDAIIEIGPDGQIYEANQAFVNLMGYTQEELTVTSFFDMVQPDKREAMPRRWAELIRKGDFRNGARTIIAKDGTPRPVENWSGPLKGRNGQPDSVMTVFRDMRQTLADQETLRQSEEHYRTIYDHLNDAVVQIGEHGEILDANRAFEELLGYSTEELTSISFFDLVPEERRGSMPAKWKRFAQASGAGLVRRNLVAKDGSLRPTENWSGPLKSMDGQGTTVLTIFRDLRQQLEDEAALLYSEERYRSIYESLNDGILNLGPQGEILGCNQAFAILSGYTPQELSCMSLQDLSRPEWKDRVPTAIQDILQGKSLEKVQRAIVNREGIVVPIEIWSRALVDGRGASTSVYLVARDLRQEQQAQQVNRELAVMEERTRFAREIHDTVAQTLTGLVNQLDSTEYLVPEELEDVLRYVGDAKELARACLTQTRSALLDLQPMELKPGGLTDGIRTEALALQEKGLPVEVIVQGEEPMAANERSALAAYRIVQEALSNSFKHSQAKSVTIELIYGPEDLVLQIVDDGVGFDVNAQRAQGQQGLTGFGMGVMDERSRVAGGELTVVSARGAGTRIIGRIPYVPTDATPSISLAEEDADQALSIALQDLGTCRIMLVDDHELVRRGTRAWLDGTEDMDVVGEADTGEWAVVKAQELEPDVILMDIHMPSMDGIEATKRITAALPDCRIILLTVYDDDDHIREGIRAGAKGYLVKGAGRDEVLNGIRTVFAGGSLVPASALGTLASPPAQDNRPDITAREREVLKLLASGAPTKEIAATLVVSENTVNYHLRNLYQKLGVKNRTQAIRASESAGLLQAANSEAGFG